MTVSRLTIITQHFTVNLYLLTPEITHVLHDTAEGFLQVIDAVSLQKCAGDAALELERLNCLCDAILISLLLDHTHICNDFQ